MARSRASEANPGPSSSPPSRTVPAEVCHSSREGSARTTAWAGQTLPATALALLVVSVFWHARLGLQVVVEDYIHTPWLEIALQLLVKAAYALAAIASVVAIGRIAFTA